MTTLKRGRWSTPELVRLRRLFPRTAIERIARQLNRSVESVRTQGQRLFEQPPVDGPWVDEADLVLRRGYGVVEIQDLAAVLGRTPEAVALRAAELRATRTCDGAWSAQEIALLKDLYPGRADEDLEVSVSHSGEQIRQRASELCLRKDKCARATLIPVRMPRWTPAEVARLRALYPNQENLVIARELERSVTSVANKAHQLGLKKCAEIRQRIGASNAANRLRR